MTIPSEFDTAAYLSQMETVTGISVQDEWRSAVIAHIENATRMARALEDVSIENHSLDLAGVFVAGETR